MKDELRLNVHRGGTLPEGNTTQDKKHREKIDVCSEKELQNCNFAKTVLMILVVLYHSMVFWTGTWFTADPVFTAPFLCSFSQWLNSFHIYGFALISGYIFCYLKCEQGKYEKFIPFVKNKAKRLLLPFLFISLVWAIPVQCLLIPSDIWTILRKYALATAPAQLWFLVMLFDVFVMFWVLTNFFAKHDFLGALVVVGAYGVGIVGKAVLPNVFMIWTACQYLPVFWLGFKIRQYGSGLIRKIPAVIYILLDILLFFVAKRLGTQNGILFKLLDLGCSFLLNVVGALMAFAVLQKIGDKINWNNGFFRFLSKRNMVVYVLHQQVIYFCIVWLNGLINPYINAAVNFFVSLGISLLLATVLLKFRVTRFLVGEK